MNTTFRRSLFAAAVMVCVSSISGAQTSATLLGYTTAVPVGWAASKPTSSMRLAQYTVRGADATTASDVVVYFFGEGQGGGIAENLERWKGQFSMPDGTAPYEHVTKEPNTAFPITIAEYRGTYARGVGAGNDAAAKPGQTLIAAVAETPRGTLFFQLYGPSAAVAAQRRALVGFVRGLH